MKDTALIRQQMHEILDIVLDGNGFEERKRALTGTLPTLFFEYNGHVNNFNVRLCIDGWQSGVYGDKEWRFEIGSIKDAEIESLRLAVQAALTDKDETDVLRRDILRQEGKVKDEKDTLAQLRKTLKRKEKAAAKTAT